MLGAVQSTWRVRYMAYAKRRNIPATNLLAKSPWHLKDGLVDA